MAKKAAKRKTTARKTAAKRASKSPTTPAVKKKKTGRPRNSPEKIEAIRLANNEERRQRRAALRAIAKRARANAEMPPAPRSGPAKKSAQTPFVPTKEDRARVEMLSGLGMRTDECALMVTNPATGLSIDQTTLAAHFERELAIGPVKANAKVAESIYRKAIGNGHASVTAAIWYSKCRMGWKERLAVDVEIKSGVLVVPAGQLPEDWIADMAAKAATAVEPGKKEK